MSQRVLQELLHIQPGSMSEIAGKLEAGGLIIRERSEEDKRRVTVSITERGRAALAARPEEAQDALKPLTTDEQQSLENLLDKLIAAWGDKRKPPLGFRGARGHHPGMGSGSPMPPPHMK